MVRLQIAILASTLGLVLVACSPDRPANDASNANDADTTSTGGAPTGNSRPSDDTTGTDMAPDSTSTGPGSPGSSNGNTGSSNGLGPANGATGQ